MSIRKRKQRKGPYTGEYRLNALTHYVSVNSNVKQACLDLKIPRTTLYLWIHQYPEYIEQEKVRQHIPAGKIEELQKVLLSLPPSKTKLSVMEQILQSLLDRIVKLAPIEPDLYKITNALIAINNAILSEKQSGKIKSSSIKNIQ